MSWLVKPRVVVDTNIFISGLLFGGNPSKILKLVKNRKVELLISPQLYLEIFSKLKTFAVSQDFLENLKLVLDYGATKVTPKKIVNICRDQKDNMLLALSREGQADFLITGDKDLLVLKRFHQTKILKPKEFLSQISKTTVAL